MGTPPLPPWEPGDEVRLEEIGEKINEVFFFSPIWKANTAFGLVFFFPWKFEIHNHKAFIENTAPSSNI